MSSLNTTHGPIINLHSSLTAIMAQPSLEERTVSLRRLGEKQTRTGTLDDVTAELSAEALPPDLSQ